ncbi:MAG: flippase-like domain-containing protein [Chloroflexi bacterium]|nr:flippase-like domain-containing protein [Chloroflexota bacterium]
MTDSFTPQFDTNQRPSILTWIKRHRSGLLLWGRLIIAFALMAFVVSLVLRDQDKLRSVNWTLIPFAWLLMLVSTAIKAYRWGLLIHQSHMDLPFRRLLGSYLVGAFFSTVLPTSVGGDAVRAVDTAASTGRVADSTSSVLIERGIGLLSVIGAGSLFALFLESGQVPLAFVLMIHALFVAGIVVLIVLRQGWFMGPIAALMRRVRLGKYVSKVNHLQAAFSSHLKQPGVLGAMLLLSIAANALTMGATYLVLVAVTNPIGVGAFVPMIALTTAAELIPISPASLGVKESAYVFFLGLAGVGSGSAGVIAIIMRGLTWGHALLGGLVFLSRTVQSTQDEATPVP